MQLAQTKLLAYTYHKLSFSNLMRASQSDIVTKRLSAPENPLLIKCKISETSVAAQIETKGRARFQHPQRLYTASVDNMALYAQMM